MSDVSFLFFGNPDLDIIPILLNIIKWDHTKNLRIHRNHVWDMVPPVIFGTGFTVHSVQFWLQPLSMDFKERWTTIGFVLASVVNCIIKREREMLQYVSVCNLDSLEWIFCGNS